MGLSGAGYGCLTILSLLGFVLLGVPQISDFVDEVSEKTETVTVSKSSSNKTSSPKGTASAKFKKIKIEHNVCKDGVNGMNVITAFSVKNMIGSEGLCAVYFEYDNGAHLKGRTRKYTTSNGQLAVSTRITPSYNPSYYTGLTFFVPYDQVVLSPGTHKLRCYANVFEDQGSSYKQLATSKYAKFSLIQR